MIEMAEDGARVLHCKCVKMAKKEDIKIIVKSTFNFDSIGTVIYEEGEINDDKNWNNRIWKFR